MSTLPSRFVIGSRIDATSYADACDRIQAWAQNRESRYVVAANVHVVMTAHWDKTYQKVINQADLVTPDGMPLVWGLRLLGIDNQQRVYGPDLMLAWCDRAARLEIPIYLYGSTPQTLERLTASLQTKFPHLIIAGSYAPPFLDIDKFGRENNSNTSRSSQAYLFPNLVSDIENINKSGAAIVFIGLGCPKQEYWMAEAQGKLNAVAIGVGAAFDFHSGQVSQAPRWMMRLGLEWLYRLSQEPKRLWQRYLINNPTFIGLFTWQLLKYKLFKRKN